jgi:hypothetical protein
VKVDKPYVFDAPGGPEELAERRAYYNYATGAFPVAEAPGLSVFYRDGDGTIYHTYSCYARGLDMLKGAYRTVQPPPRAKRAAVGCNRKFDGCSEPSPPVARASSTVRDRHDFDFIVAYPIDQAERKEREHVASSTPAMTRPRERVLSDSINRVSHLLAKSVGRGEISSRVPVIGRFRLLRRSRMEPDGCRSHSAPVQPGSNLFPGDCLN